MDRSDSASSSNHHFNIASDQHLRTSSLLSRKVYGRVAEKDFIIKLITKDQSDVVTVLPIVGIAGAGKTALAQLIYNDSEVENKFHHMIWVWVSRNFDEVRITREMLDFFPRERYEGISSFAKLQEILKEHMKNHTEYQSKKFLLILDDVWDNLDDYRWNKLLAPLIASQVTGNVILVTTRNLSVAKRLGTLKPVMLSALADDDFWLLLKSRAFGDENYEGNQGLCNVGRQIAEKLKGNPLAAETAGGLLRKDLTIDHWSHVLKDEHWKSLQLSRGIMPALKLSYDQLPFHLQQCFSYTSIFPSSYQFLGKDLVRIWISQGFVKKSDHSSKRLEEIGQYYLTELVNLGFFQQIEGKKESYLGSQIWYSVCGLMHDFARMVSRTECATIDGLQRNKILASIQHLSIVTDSTYNSIDQHGNILRNEKFEENLRNAVTSVSKLRTLVLLGLYDSLFLQLFKDIFQKAENLRLLQMSASSADFNSLMCSLVNPAHLRYLKREPDGLDGALPLVLINFFHLQVLDVGPNTDPIVSDGMHNLVCMRHVVAEKGVYSKIANIGSMTSLQELVFKVQLSSSGFGITQLRSMNELVQLELSQLDSVKTREEANRARLGDKVHLEKLHLSWEATSLQELLPVDGSGPSSEPYTETAKEVLQGLKPHMDLKHLHISGYNGTTSPTWLSSNMSLISLQTLHLEDCGGWIILPSLVSLPSLTKLKLSSMQEVTEVLVPELEELFLIKMPKLVRCSSTSVEDLCSSLKVLQIEKCHALKVFDLFENDDEYKIEQRSWLPGLRKLILRDCPQLEVFKPLPPSTNVSEILISGVSTLPFMEGSGDGTLHIGPFDECSVESWVLDNKILAFHNLRSLKVLSIDGCKIILSFSLEGFSQLLSLKHFIIWNCKKLFSSDIIPDATHEDLTAANWKAFPSLESLKIKSCGIAEKWLCLLLRHAPYLEKLDLEDISIEEGDSSSGDQDDALTRLDRDGLVHSSLKKIIIYSNSEEPSIFGCRKLFSSLVHKDASDDQANRRWLLPTSLEELDISYDCSGQTLQPCFSSDRTSLKILKVQYSAALESLQLHSCTALEELTIEGCESLTALEGLQSLGSLRHLALSDCPGLPPYLESFSRQGYKLFPRLETLEMNDPSVLTKSFCNSLSSLRRLKLEALVLNEEQERALVLLTSLQQLEFYFCHDLVDLPAGLHLLPSLKWLKIRLPETGLPFSLEELEINLCSKELRDQCRLLATGNLKVRIDCEYVN